MNYAVEQRLRLIDFLLAHKGFWPKVAAIFFAPYAWYLVVERALIAIGWA